METSSVGTNPNSNSSSPPTSNSSTFGFNLTPLRVLRYPLSTFLEYSGLLRVRPDNPEAYLLIPDNNRIPDNSESISNSGNSNASSSGEVSIRINENDGVRSEGVGVDVMEERGSSSTGSGGNRDSSSSYQRYDIQQAARLIEQILPFSLLLVVVFIRQHLQGILFFSHVCNSTLRPMLL